MTYPFDILFCACLRLLVAAWGQPLSLSFVPNHGAVLYSSETQTVMMPMTDEDSSSSGGGTSSNGWSKGMATHR